MNIFEKIIDFFHSIFSGDPAEVQRMRDLRQIYQFFKPARFRFVTKNNEATSLFANQLYLLFKAIQPIYTLLKESLFNEHQKISLLYHNHLVEGRIEDSVLEKKAAASKEYMLEKLNTSLDLDKTIKTIEKEMHSFENYLLPANFPTLDREYHQVNLIWALATYNYDRVFSKFDPVFKPSDPVSSPKFENVFGSEIVEDIRDLYYIISAVNPNVNPVPIFETMANILKPDYSAKLKKQLTHSFKTIIKIITETLNIGKLAAMIRYISDNPYLKLETEKKYYTILDDYKRRLHDTFLKNKDLVMRQYQESNIKKEIKEVFTDAILLPINGYTDNLAMLLEKFDFSPIKNILPLRILKSFVISKFENEVKNDINKIIVEGYFKGKEFQNSFSTIYYKCCEVVSDITRLEENIATNPNNSFHSLNLIIAKYEHGKKNENAVLKTIEVIEEKIDTVLFSSANLLYKLTYFLYEILQDYKSKEPNHISNLKSIGGTKNREYMSKMLNSYNNFSKFIKLIKHFTIIEPQKEKQNA